MTTWPDASNTGPTTGTVFTNQSGEITTAAAGQTIEKRNITAGYIYIRHANTIVQDCIVDMTGLAPATFFQAISAGTSAPGCIIRRCTVIGNAGKDCIQTEFLTNVDISFCDLSKMENGISLGSSGNNIHDNYIHGLQGTGVPHIDGIQGTGLFNGVTIEHNTIISFDTSGIIMQTEFGGFSNVIINNNKIGHSAPVSFGMLIQETTPGAVSNVTVTNNRIQSDKVATPTFEYAVFHNINGLRWAGNVDDDTGALVNYRDDGGNIAAVDPVIQPSPGNGYPGAWSGPKQRKKRKRDEIEELLELVQAAPPPIPAAPRPTGPPPPALIDLAPKLQAAGLTPPQRRIVKRAIVSDDEDDDDEAVALLLELLS